MLPIHLVKYRSSWRKKIAEKKAKKLESLKIYDIELFDDTVESLAGKRRSNYDDLKVDYLKKKNRLFMNIKVELCDIFHRKQK